MGIDNSVSVDKFCKNFKIEVNRLTEDEISLHTDLISHRCTYILRYASN
jgi:hypothetical protein